MKALIFDPTQPGGIRLDEAPAPEPTASQALIEIHAASLNFGDVFGLSRMHKPGEVPGWDAAGIVVRAAADGSGPPTGTHVSTFGWGGAWAELRAADTREIGLAPANVDFGAASAIPVAGVTALRALRALGPIIGRRVLITGASGGVGCFAVQLAHLAGAHVVASVRTIAKGGDLVRLGADEVTVGVDALKEPVDAVIEQIGGETLARAFSMLASGGTLQSVGASSLEASTIDFNQQRLTDGRRAAGRRLEVFSVGSALGPDISYILSLVASHRLDPCIGWRGAWQHATEAADALLKRQFTGKAVIDIR